MRCIISTNKPIKVVPAMFQHPGTRSKYTGGTSMKSIICGIYAIVNVVNGKKYIGSSADVNLRWINHKTKLNHNKHVNRILKSAWNKYGADRFVFVVLEQCSKPELLQREQHHIDNGNPEYNIAKSSTSPLIIERPAKCVQCGHDYTAKALWSRFCSNACKSKWRRKNHFDDTSKKCVVCGSEFSSNKYAKTTTCSSVCRGKLLWRNISDESRETHSEKLSISKIDYYAIGGKNHAAKPIDQFSIDGEYIASFASAALSSGSASADGLSVTAEAAATASAQLAAGEATAEGKSVQASAGASATLSTGECSASGSAVTGFAGDASSAVLAAGEASAQGHDVQVSVGASAVLSVGNASAEGYGITASAGVGASAILTAGEAVAAGLPVTMIAGAIAILQSGSASAQGHQATASINGPDLRVSLAVGDYAATTIALTDRLKTSMNVNDYPATVLVIGEDV